MQIVTASETTGRIASTAKRLTGRKRRRLKKQFNKARSGRSWVDRFVADGLRFYRSEWTKTAEPPGPAVARMLRRVAERVDRRGELDLRRMDRRFWELVYACGWNPMAFDKSYWPREWQQCRRHLEGVRYSQVHTIRDRVPDDAQASEVAEAYAAPVTGNVYEWWISLLPPTRRMLMEDARAILAIEGPTERQKRRNEKSRHS